MYDIELHNAYKEYLLETTLNNNFFLKPITNVNGRILKNISLFKDLIAVSIFLTHMTSFSAKTNHGVYYMLNFMKSLSAKAGLSKPYTDNCISYF